MSTYKGGLHSVGSVEEKQPALRQSVITQKMHHFWCGDECGTYKKLLLQND